MQQQSLELSVFGIAQKLPDAQLIMYPDAGHGAIFRYAERSVAHATLFLQERTQIAEN